MMDFTDCHGPIWVVDDVPECYQDVVLKTCLPALAFSISAIWHFVSPPEEIVEIGMDQPKEQHLIVITEMVAIIGLVLANVIKFATSAYGFNEQMASITGIAIWLYVFALTVLQLVVHNYWRKSRLRCHTALIYTCQWIFILPTFRSAIIHPRSTLAQILAVIEFSLISLVFGISVARPRVASLQWDNELEPSQEPVASLYSLVTFSWISPTLWKGYRTTLKSTDIYDLAPEDRAANIVRDYQKIERTRPLKWHLLYYFRWSLFIQCFYAFFSTCFACAPPLLLKAILEYIENSASQPQSAIWLYVILLALSGIIESWLDNQACWIGHKLYGRLRAIIVSEVYAKTLCRKIATSSDTVFRDKKDKNDARRSSLLKRFFGLSGKKAKSANEAMEDPLRLMPKIGDDSQASMGTITNLISADANRIAVLGYYLYILLSVAPTQLVVCAMLLWQIIGWSFIPGLIASVFFISLNIRVLKGYRTAETNIRALKDKRIDSIRELFKNIIAVKLFAWEPYYGEIIDEKRVAELKALRWKYMTLVAYRAISRAASVSNTFISFLCYTLIAKKPLHPSIAFSVISLFKMLQISLSKIMDHVEIVQGAVLCLKRMEKFLSETGTEKYDQLQDDDEMIGFKAATLSWVSKEAIAADDSAFCLRDINIKFIIGKLNVITGPVGSGKSSLLMALLGEMTMLEGRVYLPRSHNREHILPNPETGLTDTVAYCAEQAWLINASIKDNILFGMPLDEQRYRDVIFACALEQDLRILDAGNETLVGENGIMLSGGQKQRISLARAVYSPSRHLLLDDFLNTLDSHTSKWIFNNCFTGPLMQNRTCILVTHNMALSVPFSEYVVVLENGTVAIQGSTEELIASGNLGANFEELSGKAKIAPLVEPNRTSMENSTSKTIDPKALIKKQQETAIGEEKAGGGIKLDVMKLYFKAMGPRLFWTVSFLAFGLQQVLELAGNIWIRHWANQYSTREKIHSTPSNTILINRSVVGSKFLRLISHFDPTGSSALATSTSDINSGYYFVLYALMTIGSMAVAVVKDLWFFHGSLTASRTIHKKLTKSTSGAKFNFFDVTPLGQIITRFSKDIYSIDQEITPKVQNILNCALAIVAIIGLIVIITPGFLIAAFFISLLYFGVCRFYIRSSRDLKGLESVQQSPLIQHFLETFSGIATIRAYGDKERFMRGIESLIAEQNRLYISLKATKMWFDVRVGLIDNLVALFSGIFIIYSLGRIDAGQAVLPSLTR